MEKNIRLLFVAIAIGLAVGSCFLIVHDKWSTQVTKLQEDLAVANKKVKDLEGYKEVYERCEQDLSKYPAPTAAVADPE